MLIQWLFPLHVWFLFSICWSVESSTTLVQTKLSVGLLDGWIAVFFGTDVLHTVPRWWILTLVILSIFSIYLEQPFPNLRRTLPILKLENLLGPTQTFHPCSGHWHNRRYVLKSVPLSNELYPPVWILFPAMPPTDLNLQCRLQDVGRQQTYIWKTSTHNTR